MPSPGADCQCQAAAPMSQAAGGVRGQCMQLNRLLSAMRCDYGANSLIRSTNYECPANFFARNDGRLDAKFAILGCAHFCGRQRRSSSASTDAGEWRGPTTPGTSACGVLTATLDVLKSRIASRSSVVEHPHLHAEGRVVRIHSGGTTPSAKRLADHRLWITGISISAKYHPPCRRD